MSRRCRSGIGWSDAIVEVESTQLQAVIGVYEAARITEDEALLQASGGRTLSEAAIAELRNILGL
jgi:hypothetical protein